MVEYQIVSKNGDTICLQAQNFITHVKDDFKYGLHKDIFSFTWHRIGGPACEDFDGELYWYVDDEQYSLTREYCEACEFDGETTLCWMLKHGDFLPQCVGEL